MDKSTLRYFFSRTWHRKEGFIWLAALIWLALDNPGVHHYTLCPLDNLGFPFCPGCGLGRSIGFLFRLDVESSVAAHPLGIPALILLLWRIIKVFSRKEFTVLPT